MRFAQSITSPLGLAVCGKRELCHPLKPIVVRMLFPPAGEPQTFGGAVSGLRDGLRRAWLAKTL
jgi:hypothetical protein